jgi:hypothetical protein
MCNVTYTPLGETEPIEFTEAQFVAFLASGEYDKIIDKFELDLPKIGEENFSETDVQDLVNKIVAANPNEIGKNLKAFIFAMNNAEGISDEQKKAMNERLGQYYETLTNDELIAIGKDIVEAEGGLDKAIIKAETTPNSQMPPYLKLFIYGEAVLRSVEQQKNAKTEKERVKAADENIAYIDKIDNLLRDSGRTIQFVKNLYRKTALAVTRTISNVIKARNEANMPQAQETAKGVEQILKEDDNVASALNEELEKQLNDTSKELETLKKAYEKLKSKLSAGNKPTGKKVDIGIGKTKGKEALDRLKKKNYNASQNNIMPISIQEMNDLTDYIGSQLEDGFESFEDVFDKANKELGGEYSDYYRDAYKKARDLAKEKGSKNKYSTDEEVDTISEGKKTESDADKLAKESKKIAKAEIDRVKRALSNEKNKKLLQERLKNLIPKSGNIWLKYQQSNVSQLVSKLNFTASKSQSPLLAEFSKLVSQNINEKLSELIPKANKSSVEKNKSLELADIIKNEEKFAEIYEKALDIIKEKNNAGSKSIALLEKLLEENDLSKPFSKAAILNAINQKIAQTKKSIDNIILNPKEDLQDFKENIINSIMKDANLDAEIANEIRDRLQFEIDNIFNTQSKSHYKSTAERIVNDAKTMSGLPTTKKEASLLNQLISKVAAKAKDTMANNALSPTQKTPLELITFALENAKKGEKIFNEAKKEVEAIIDNDKNLTKEQKEDLKKFLENYQKSIFDNLLSNKDKNNILKNALIELGYAKEDKNGKIVLDIDQLAFKGASVEEAINKIQDLVLSKTNFTEAEVKDLMKSLKDKLEANIAEKKAAKINSFIKSKNRVGKSGRKLRIDKLVELYRAGGMNNKEVLNHLAKDLGIVTFDAQEQAYVEDLVSRIDKAQIGNEKTVLEEELQSFFEYKEGTFALNAFFDSLRANLLSSPITAIKNISGVGQTISDFIYAAITTALKDIPSGNVDVNLFKVLKMAIKSANATSGNIIFGGGADTGSAFAEIAGQKEGVPSVRRLEKKFIPYRKFLIPKASALNKKLYLIGRILNAPDSYNHTIQADVESYMLIKDSLLKNNPNLTRKEAATQALEIVYASDITEARKQAEKEFEDRGITFDFTKVADRSRFNRRVFEILQQKRPTDIIDKANAQASRGTYKQADIGAFSMIGRGMQNAISALMRVSASLREKGKGTSQAKLYNDMATTIDVVLKSLQSAFFPIVTGAANILEKGAELTPYYGGAKSLGYLGAGLGTLYSTRNDTQENKQAAKDKANELFNKSGRYAFRSLILGQVYMMIILSLIDTDDEDKDEKGNARPKLYGTGEVNRNKNVVVREVRPSNTMVIGGKNIPTELIGGMFLALKLKALELDIERYLSDEKIDNTKRAKLTLEAITSASTLKGANDLYKYLADPTSPSSQNFLSKRLAELFTRATIPFTSFSRAAEQIREPQAKQAITLGENILRYSGIVGGWALDRKAYDVLGNEYDTKDLYTSGAGGTIGMFTKPVEKPLLSWVLKATGNNATVSSVNTKQSAYLIPDPKTGELTAMSDEQYYDFGKIKAKVFGELLSGYYDKYKNRQITPETKKIAKDDISNLNEISKSIAYSVMFSGASKDVLLKESKDRFYKNVENKLEDKKDVEADFEKYNATDDDRILYDLNGKNWSSFKYDDLLPRLNKTNNKLNELIRWAKLGIITKEEKTELKKYYKLN